VLRQLIENRLVVEGLACTVRVFGIQEPNSSQIRILFQLRHQVVEFPILRKIRESFARRLQDVMIGLGKELLKNRLFAQS
jgi:hypothetical protein